MEERRRGAAAVESTSEIGIPTGLNPIKTRRVTSKEKLSKKFDYDDVDKLLIESVSSVAPKPPAKTKVKSESHGFGKIVGAKEGLRKGKKLARWFTAPLNKVSGQAFTEDGSLEIRRPDKKVRTRSKLHKEGKPMTNNQTSLGNVFNNKPSKTFKSFSHEIGPRGGTPPAQPRVHSYDDLKELLGSLHSRFDDAKEIVNAELTSFVRDAVDVFQNSHLNSEGRRMAEDIVIVARQCMEMDPLEFRAKCEMIVQDLTERRQHHQPGLLKWLVTQMLFILTRCTRLLQFQKDSEPIDEKSLHKLKTCLDSIPTVELSWVHPEEATLSSSDHGVEWKNKPEYKLQQQKKTANLLSSHCCKSEEMADHERDISSRIKSMALEDPLLSRNSHIDFISHGKQYHRVDGNSPGESINGSSGGYLYEQEQSLNGPYSVICRICDECVPTSYLESHSYICAYADKYDSKFLDVDERLFKLAEVVELIIESQNTSSINASDGSPDNTRTQATNPEFVSAGYSPKISEWRNKGVEEMFEELHEMDTACIDDSYLTNTSYMKGILGMKLGHCSAPSSTGSITSASSINTPRASHFDFWLEHNNPSELENVRQMADLADIARCVAGTNLSEEGSIDFLLACMQDLQELLQHSKLKALVIDTFGGRIENLLREKYILACDSTDTKSLKSNVNHKETSKLLVDSPSQSTATSTPLHPLYKERTSIDDFEIIKPISRGAFGKVFLARKRTTGDLFAIKVLKKLDMIRKNDIERILAERNILITVRNPFVVRFFYSFTCRENLYLVMEYLNGGDLYSLLRKVGCLQEDVAQIYIAELVLALEYLHSLGIVHRDLKPDNILIAHDGHIKLTDFGLSKIGLLNSTVELSGPEATDTNSVASHDVHPDKTDDRNIRSAVGTPDYLAPEILLGTAHGYAADWWSVGIILFELITGVPPFTAGRPEIIFDNILNRKIPWPDIPNDMSYEAQDLIERLLIHDPKQRLGAAGPAEVKSHPFFKGVNWDTLALQKAAFVPQPDSADDTSYFVSRYASNTMSDDRNCGASDCDSTDSESGAEWRKKQQCGDWIDQVEECDDLAEFQPSPLDLSLINFSFKNYAQLASINYDLLLQSVKDSTKCALSCRGANS